MGFTGKGSRLRAQKRRAMGNNNLVPGNAWRRKNAESDQSSMTAEAGELKELNCKPGFYRVPEVLQVRAGPNCCLSPLRPKTEVPQSSCGAELGNRVVSLDKLAEIITFCVNNHAGSHRAAVKVLSVKDQGLGTTITVRCTKCCFIHSQKLYNEAQHEGKGHRPAMMNVQLGAFLYKSPISMRDINLLFSCLDCHPPSITALQKTVNKCSETYAKLNTHQMAENCRLIKYSFGDAGVNALTDTVYNNPPKGRGMYQPGTQSQTPLIEADTGLVLAQKTFSKLGPHANIDQHKAMDSTEADAICDNIKTAASNGLRVKVLVSDGCTKLARSLNALGNIRPEKQRCIVHVSRCQRKKVYGTTFSKQMVGKSTHCQYSYRRANIAEKIVNRCATELAIAKKKYGPDTEKFYAATERARLYIVDCLCGSHTNCTKNSLCCKGNVKLSCPAFNIATPSDIRKMQKIVNYKMSKESIKNQKYGLSTNKVEALHLRTLKVAPKTKLFIRNFDARAHSAMHNHSMGTAGSLRLACVVMGAPIRSYKANCCLHRMQQLEMYGRCYKQRLYVLSRRRRGRNKRIKMKIMSKLNVQSAQVIPSDHEYCRKSS
jgi:hypothetical protein